MKTSDRLAQRIARVNPLKDRAKFDQLFREYLDALSAERRVEVKALRRKRLERS